MKKETGIFWIQFEDVNIYGARGRYNTNVSLDDVARALGHDICSELSPVIDALELKLEIIQVPLVPRGFVDMISLAGAKRLAEAYLCTQGPRLAMKLEENFNEFDHIRYNGLPATDIERYRKMQSVARMLLRDPDVSAAVVAEDLEIDQDEAAGHLNFLRTFKKLGDDIGFQLV